MFVVFICSRQTSASSYNGDDVKCQQNNKRISNESEVELVGRRRVCVIILNFLIFRSRSWWHVQTGSFISITMTQWTQYDIINRTTTTEN